MFYQRHFGHKDTNTNTYVPSTFLEHFWAFIFLFSRPFRSFTDILHWYHRSKAKRAKRLKWFLPVLPRWHFWCYCSHTHYHQNHVSLRVTHYPSYGRPVGGGINDNRFSRRHSRSYRSRHPETRDVPHRLHNGHGVPRQHCRLKYVTSLLIFLGSK